MDNAAFWYTLILLVLITGEECRIKDPAGRTDAEGAGWIFYQLNKEIL